MAKRYRLHFSSGKTVTIDEEDYSQLVNDMNSGGPLPQFMGYKHGLIVNMNFLTHIDEEEPVDLASHVVTPPTPDAIKRQEEFKKQQEMSNVEGLLGRHKKREENDKLS